MATNNLLVCPACQRGGLVLAPAGWLRCAVCAERYPIVDGIVDLLTPEAMGETTLNAWNAFYTRYAAGTDGDFDYYADVLWPGHLFRYLPADLAGKTIVDLGCGSAIRIARIIPRERYGYEYIGVDGSLLALRTARCNVPGSTLICGEVRDVALRADSVDVVCSLGLLMYCEDYEQVLDRFLQMLKPGGILLMHEQVRRPSWRRIIGAAGLSTGRTYPPVSYVDANRLRRCLENRGTIVHVNRSGSPLRGVLMALRGRHAAGGHQYELIEKLDNLLCRTIGRLSSAIGAGELQIVFRKAHV